MDKKKILVIDDDIRFGRIARTALEETGKYEVRVEIDGTEALASVKKFGPDLVLLDIMIPDISGLEICREMKARERYSSTPVIMLSGKTDESDKVTALDAGADDYIVKPFAVHELDARIRAVLRRARPEGSQDTLSIGKAVVIDPKKHKVTVNGKTVELTAAEFVILSLLASREKRVFTRSEILDHLWGDEKVVIERTIDVHIRHLRQKLGAAGKFIINVRGVGYKAEE